MNIPKLATLNGYENIITIYDIQRTLRDRDYIHFKIFTDGCDKEFLKLCGLTCNMVELLQSIEYEFDYFRNNEYNPEDEIKSMNLLNESLFDQFIKECDLFEMKERLENYEKKTILG